VLEKVKEKDIHVFTTHLKIQTIKKQKNYY